MTKRLREFHDLGRKIIAKGHGGRIRYGYGQLLQKEFGHDPSYLFNARKFADVYSTEQLEELCQLGGDRGAALGPSHVTQLLSVEPAAGRRALAKKCAAGRWSVVRLRRELERTRGKKPYGGRAIKPADSTDAALAELQVIATRWQRWITANTGTAAGVGKLPRRVRTTLEKIARLLPELEGALKSVSQRARKSKGKPVPRASTKR